MVQKSQITEAKVSAALGLSISCGIVSVVGSTMIIVILLRSPKKLTSPYRRLVFGMSCMDIIHSLSFVLAGLPSPADNKYARNAIGNICTCNIQGLMAYSGCMGSVTYDCMLSIYFVMVVVYSKREDFIRHRIEPFFHALSALVPLAAGIFLIATTSFNASGYMCWISPSPLVCSAPWADPDVKVECTRGKNAMAYRKYFQVYPLLLAIFIIIGCMIRLSCAIRAQLKNNKKYGSSQFEANVARKRRASMKEEPSTPVGSQLQYRNKTINAPDISKTERKETFTQALLYIMALLLTFFFAFIYQIFPGGRKQYWLYLLQVSLVPLLGFFNFFIFIRPRVFMTRQCNPELSFFQAFITAVTSKEVKPPARRGTVSNRMRRSSLPFTGRMRPQTPRVSYMSSDSILAAVQIVQREEEVKEQEANQKKAMEDDHKLENKHQLKNGLPKIVTNYSLDITGGLESNDSDSSLGSNAEAQEWKDTPVVIEEDAALNMTEDFHNMI